MEVKEEEEIEEENKLVEEENEEKEEVKVEVERDKGYDVQKVVKGFCVMYDKIKIKIVVRCRIGYDNMMYDLLFYKVIVYDAWFIIRFL